MDGVSSAITDPINASDSGAAACRAVLPRGVPRLPSSEAKRILTDLVIGQGTALRALKLCPAIAGKNGRQERTLSAAESERVIGIAGLVGQLEAMIQESGDPEGFDAPSWMSRWLQEPLPSLGGRLPIDLMDTMEGQALVSTAIARVRGEAYA